MEELRPQVRSILFVCTGNVFRSVAAEHGLKTLFGQPSLYRIGSAGIEGKPQHLHERYPNWQQHHPVRPNGLVRYILAPRETNFLRSLLCVASRVA